MRNETDPLPRIGPTTGERVIAQVGEIFNQRLGQVLQWWAASVPQKTKRDGAISHNIHLCSSPPSPIDRDSYGSSGISTQNEYHGLPVS